MSAMRLLPLVLLLPACDAVRDRPPGREAPAASVASTAPAPRPVVPAGARTADAFDTTTEAERAAALAPVEAAEEPLGTTIASLGDPADPGLWLETPLVTETRPGRVALPGTAQSVKVELRPIEGPATGGSRISLPAIRLLGASLAGLPEVEVFGL